VLPRAQLDRRLRAANPGFAERATALADELRVNPDGDVDLPEDVVAGFTVVPCPVCEVGVLKPDVVFFGEQVPRDRVQRAFELLAASPSLLVLGSSLTVMSGYRFVRAAARAGQPVAVVNAGPTRGDGEASVRLDAPLERVLPELVEALSGR
jgi:NAD-dependent SIR2 family protein deacetylase